MAWATERLSDQPPPFPPTERLPLVRGSLAVYAAMTPLQVLRRLESTRHGLQEAEAQARLARQGENEIALGRVPRWGSRVLAAVRSPFIVGSSAWPQCR